jgi:hypothetical protein
MKAKKNNNGMVMVVRPPSYYCYKRFHLRIWGASASLLENIRVVKARTALAAEARFYDFALHEALCYAEGYLHLTKQVDTEKMVATLKALGATSVECTTFGPRDRFRTATLLICHTWRTATQPGFRRVTGGVCEVRFYEHATHAFEMKGLAMPLPPPSPPRSPQTLSPSPPPPDAIAGFAAFVRTVHQEASPPPPPPP